MDDSGEHIRYVDGPLERDESSVSIGWEAINNEHRRIPREPARCPFAMLTLVVELKLLQKRIEFLASE